MSGSPPVEHADSSPLPEGPPSSIGPAVDEPLSLRPQFAVDDDNLLEQVSQISGHLKAQLSEIDRREQTLTEQLAALDQERRTMRLWVQQFEDETVQRATRLRAQEASLADKIDTCERLTAELQNREAALEAARAELQAERDRLRNELEQELAADWDEIQTAREALEARRQSLADEIEQHRREHEETQLAARRELEAERDRLRRELHSERELQRLDLQREQREWETRRDAQQADLERERELSDLALTRAQEELAQQKQLQAETLEREAEEHAARLAARQQAQDDELAAQREQFAQEQSYAQARLRFQQDHLQKTREELETTQRAFRIEQQRDQIRREHDLRLLRLRRTQLEQIHHTLDRREQSLERQSRLLAEAQQTFDHECRHDRARLHRQREAWELERQAQQAEVTRQQDVLAVHAENLEARKSRLDRLRVELEETHRSTLEMRLAVEEAWAQLAQSAGAEVARSRVDDARRGFSEHYRHLRDALEQQQAEVIEARTRLQQQRDELRNEQNQLTAWMTERDERLRLWEEDVRRDAESIDAREAAWREIRDRWMREKLEAETIIRDLLRQLAETTEAAAESPPSDDAQPVDDSSTPRADELPAPHWSRANVPAARSILDSRD